MKLREDANKIIEASLRAAQPDRAVQIALKNADLSGNLYLAAVGKAAWQMAYAASKLLTFQAGIVITKYGHCMGEIPRVKIFEAGHPVPDRNSFCGTKEVLDMTSHLTGKDTVIFLLSGGGSSLFELPLIPEDELADITQQLLACGADIVEMNTIRKRLSRVKGGRFAQHCLPARMFSVVLSDIVGDPLDMIASGPAAEDCSTCEEAMAIVKKYNLKLSRQAAEFLKKETPKKLGNVETHITGSVRQLCAAAAKEAEKLGYETQILTDSLTCTARDAGSFLASIARYHKDTKKSLAFVAGGETVVKLTGKGIGGRNQELALAAAEGIAGMKNTAVFSVGSDGTDGPTDAAGGYVDQDTFRKLEQAGISISDILCDNNAYSALQCADGLIMTGPTGTNVNDVSVLLIRR
ncbi:glycerate kinase [Candidatus Merdisoma sp. JLR.KK006]|mgnify:CR=1 FL=1|uniref:glycerate kinase type-2 family protein n=1 Tax=Candidatus Merdisoma sp. JLR.KK006 TaxID=3112626 RepID=UPI002FF3E021